MTVSMRAPADAVAARERKTLMALAIGNFALPFQNMMVIPSIPTIERSLGASELWGTWLLTGFLLVSAIAAPILGRLGDQFGKRRVLNVSLGVFLLGALGATVAPSIGVLIVCRLLQGVGGAVIPLAFSIVKDEFSRERARSAMAVLASMGALGSGVALTVSGVVVGAFGWRVLFALAAVLVALACVGALLYVPESSRRVKARVDVRGGVLLALALIALLLTMTEAPHWGWGSPRAAVGFTLASCLLAAWFRTEARAAEPMVDLAMLSRRPVLLGNVAGTLGSGFGLTSALLLLPRFMSEPAGQAHYGFSAGSTEVGLLMLPWALSGLAGALVTSRIVRRFGARWLLIAGGLLMAAGLAALAVAHDSRWEVVLWLTITGCGTSLTGTGVVAVVVDNVRPLETGVATGMSTVLRQLGSTTGAQLMAAILAADVVAGTTIPSERAFTITFALCAVGAALSALCGALVPRRAARAHADDDETGV